MTDEATAAAPANDAAQPSQLIQDTGTDPSATGRGTALPDAEQPAKEPAKLSTRDAIAKALEDAEAKAEGAEKQTGSEKAKSEEPATAGKPEKPRGEDGKFAKAEKPADVQEEARAEKGVPEKAAAERSASEEPRQSEGRKYAEPPARFLPEARTKWANVPNEVKAEFHRVADEYERELVEHRQFREELREYEELAKQHNVTIKGTLDRYVAADRLLHENFGRGVASLMQMYGHSPAQAIASILQAIGITPQMYAEYVTKNPQAAVAPLPQPQRMAPQQQPDPQVQHLQQEIESLRTQMAASQVVPVIQQFAATHPDYHALEDKIASILKSGVIEQVYGTGLSPEQKLEEAYRMAGGRPPSRSEPEPAQQHFDAPAARPVDPDGQKSIKGAPTAGHTGQPRWTPKSNREALERAFASVR